MADITKLIKDTDNLIAACEKARGTAAELGHRTPLEIHLYNLATNAKNSLENYKALLQDANGTYMKGKK